MVDNTEEILEWDKTFFLQPEGHTDKVKLKKTILIISFVHHAEIDIGGWTKNH